MSFRPAVRQQLRLRMALEGPSGSGKTITALRIAQGLGRRIAVIDTENRSASRYIGEDFGEGPIQFDVVELDSFEPKRLVNLLREAAEAGYDVVIVDSLSHFWMGEGGMLDAVDAASKRQSGGNSFAGWKAVKPAERELWDALIRCRTHLICTLRTKTEWVVEENDRGKKTPRKIGLKAEQREGLEYEFDVVGDVDLDHNLTCSKTRCSALDGRAFQRPGADVAKILRRWLDAGEAPQERPQERRDDRVQDRGDDRRDERREPDDRLDEKPAAKPFDPRAFVRSMQALDPGWTEDAICALGKLRSIDELTRERATTAYKAAQSGTLKPPGQKPAPTSNTQPAAGGEDDIP